MALLKEDGSLDIEHINKLPLEEYMDAMGKLSEEQIAEYNAKLPVNESMEPMHAEDIGYTFEEAIQSGRIVNAKEFINNLRERCKNRE